MIASVKNSEGSVMMPQYEADLLKIIRDSKSRSE